MKKQKIRIGIDIQSTQGRPTGLGTYTQNLLDHLLREKPEQAEFALLKPHSRADLNTLERLVWENVSLPWQMRTSKVDLLHVPAFSPPLFNFCKLVVTVHDIIGLMFPNQMNWPSRFYWKKWLPYTVRRADAIIADSENTKRDLIERLDLDPGKIHLVYPSGHERFTHQVDAQTVSQAKRRFNIRHPYFLFVGTVEPRKNLSGVIQAFARFLKTKKDEGPYQLVIVGKKDFGHGRAVKMLWETIQVPPDAVIYTGYVGREELNGLYCGAEAFVFPSHYEGFGIPVLEAMACGVPVLSSTASSLPEVGEDAVLAVNPSDIDAITMGLLDITQNETLREDLIAKGFRQIKKFSWKKTARETLAVYSGVLGIDLQSETAPAGNESFEAAGKY